MTIKWLIYEESIDCREIGRMGDCIKILLFQTKCKPLIRWMRLSFFFPFFFGFFPDGWVVFYVMFLYKKCYIKSTFFGILIFYKQYKILCKFLAGYSNCEDWFGLYYTNLN